MAGECRRRLAPGCAPSLRPPAMAPGGPRRVRTPGLPSSPTPNPGCGLPSCPVRPLTQTLCPLRRGSRQRPASGGSKVADSSAGCAATAGPSAPRKGSGRTRQPAAGGPAPPCGRHRTPPAPASCPPRPRSVPAQLGLGTHSHRPRVALTRRRPAPATERGPRPDIPTGFSLGVSPVTNQQAAPRAGQEAGRRPRRRH